jgi:hypothetical protein
MNPNQENMFNFNFNNDEISEIRPPDQTITDRLISDTNRLHTEDNIINIINNIDKAELELAISESIKEQEAYDKRQSEISQKTKLRIGTFKNILEKIKRVGMVDKEISDFYDVIQPMVDSYCACNVDRFECDEVMYTTIFDTLKKIRLTESEFESLKLLFVREE